MLLVPVHFPLIGHVLQVRQRREARFGRKFVEGDLRTIGHHDIATDVVAETPGEWPLPLLGMPCEVPKQGTVRSRRAAGDVPSQSGPKWILMRWILSKCC